jgi:hypothetical protein
MGVRRWKRGLAAGIAVAAPLLLGNTATGGTEARLLAAHNRERAALGVEPLRWDPGLARAARGWADRLATTGEFAHAPDNPRAPQGENLWAGTRGRYTPEMMVGGWAREKRFFKPGRFPDNSITGRVADVGHYTQLMWRDTRAVGCAVATGGREDVLVCRYAQAGNWMGEKPF